MEQLLPALISSAIVALGVLVTFMTNRSTTKSVNNISNDVIKNINDLKLTLDENNKRLIQLEHKLNRLENQNEKRILEIEKRLINLEHRKTLEVLK